MTVTSPPQGLEDRKLVACLRVIDMHMLKQNKVVYTTSATGKGIPSQRDEPSTSYEGSLSPNKERFQVYSHAYMTVLEAGSCT